jgi:hypothetical protein
MDYLEKLIQIPYTLPKLSEPEVETYITLLFCQSGLEQSDFSKMLEGFKEYRSNNRYSAFNLTQVQTILGLEKTQIVSEKVSLIAKLSPIISDSLYGNPRQIKRFLNTYMLRKELAEVSHIVDMRDDILAKLMVLEYAEPSLFEKVFQSQSLHHGIAIELAVIEELVNNKDAMCSLPDKYKEWSKEKMFNWLRIEPKLGKTNLSDYFWLSRDKLAVIQGNLLIPPIVRALLDELTPKDIAEPLTEKLLKERLLPMTDAEKDSFFNLLRQNITSEPSNKRLHEIFIACLDIIDSSDVKYVEILKLINSKLTPSIKKLISRYTKRHPSLVPYAEKHKKEGK